MGMILVIIVIAAGILWLSLLGHERRKDRPESEDGNLILPVIIAAIGGMACIVLIAGIGGEFWSIILAAAVYFGILYYFLADAVYRSRRSTKAQIAQLEHKIDELTALLKKDE
jgi:Flp pilus assembly protein TadB